MEIYSGMAGIDNTTLFYEEAGRGFPVVFIHGAGTDHTLWDDQFTVFAREYRVIRYDLRGCGRSPASPIGSSHLDDLLMLLQNRGIEQAFLVGWGTGAQIAVDFAMARPSHAAGLVLVNPSARISDTAALSIPNTGTTATGTMYSGSFRDSRDEMLTIEPATIRRLGQMCTPCIVITGENATPDVQHAARLLYTIIQGALKANLPGAGQMPNRERPTQFNRILLTFFDWVKSQPDFLETRSR